MHPYHAPASNKQHLPALLLPHVPQRFSMNRRKPISAAPYSEGCSATGGTNTRIFTFGYPRISERSRPSSTVASSSPKCVHSPPNSTVSTSTRFTAEAMAETSASAADRPLWHIRIPGSPTLEEHIDGLAAGGIPILGNAGSLDQSATARKRLKTPVTPAAAQRPIHRHGQMADLAGESVRAHHHFAVAHHRAADADIGRQVNKGVRAVHHIQEGRTFGGIPRNLSDGGHLRLIAGHHIQPAHHVEPGEVDVFPTDCGPPTATCRR